MKCTYYSAYPYNRYDQKYKHSKRNPKSSIPDFPLRFIKSAVCETDADIHTDEFAEVLFEGLDMTEYKYEKTTTPFEFDYQHYPNDVHVKVSENRNLYGATNSGDGMWEIDGVYYIKTICHGWESFNDHVSAIKHLLLKSTWFYSYENVDTELRGDECLEWGDRDEHINDHVISIDELLKDE